MLSRLLLSLVEDCCICSSVAMTGIQVDKRRLIYIVRAVDYERRDQGTSIYCNKTAVDILSLAEYEG